VSDARHRLSSYKLPTELRIVDEVPRAPNGKANYPAARELFGVPSAGVDTRRRWAGDG
jgi:acyl-CoA synthetase (AMP-forming)/AMP-acid ligase II